MTEESLYKALITPKQAERMVRRAIRGMIPIRKTKGREAYKRVKCFIGLPEEYKDKKAETIKGGQEVAKLPNLKFIKITEISKYMGAKYE